MDGSGVSTVRVKDNVDWSSSPLIAPAATTPRANTSRAVMGETELSGVTIIIIIGGGVLLSVILFIFAKRQIMRFTIRSRRGPHAPVGHDAKKVGRQIDMMHHWEVCFSVCLWVQRTFLFLLFFDYIVN